jgi:hypothetical protein
VSGRALTIVIVALALLAIAALIPPFFTKGACTAEFESRSVQAEAMKSELATVALARAYLSGHEMPFVEVSAEQCETAMPPGIEACSDGPIILTSMPVENRVCRLYRDDKVKVQLLFGRSLQLRRIQTDMKPYKIFSAPALHQVWYWAR